MKTFTDDFNNRIKSSLAAVSAHMVAHPAPFDSWPKLVFTYNDHEELIRRDAIGIYHAFTGVISGIGYRVTVYLPDAKGWERDAVELFKNSYEDLVVNEYDVTCHFRKATYHMLTLSALCINARIEFNTGG